MSPRYSEENGVVVHLLHAKVLEEHTGVSIHVGPGVLHLAGLQEDGRHQLVELGDHLGQGSLTGESGHVNYRTGC